MKKYYFFGVILLLFSISANSSVYAQQPFIDKTKTIVTEVVADRYPELKSAKIEVKKFNDDSDYFRANFSVSRYATFRNMRFYIEANPLAEQKNAPEDAIRAIIAHEVAHILYYQTHNRFELLGLAGLADKSFNAKFERKADLEAIGRGFGEGLKQYRLWLYQNIPAKDVDEKKRDYFTPEELDVMLPALKINPALLGKWKKNVPRNLEDVKRSV